MVGLILRFLVSVAALGATILIVPGIHVDNLRGLALAAFVLGILNAIIRPVLLLLTLPINLLTLGLFTFVINAALMILTAHLVKVFHIDGVWPALLGAVVLAIVSGVLNWLVKDAREKSRD